MSTQEWGNITWKLFHTLAEQVNESKFPEIKDKFINIIIDTCHHLPCPDCTEHATTIIKKAYIKNIKTKKHIIEFLRQLHNIVNIKLHKKTYTSEEIQNIYKQNDLGIIINQFINIYSRQNSSQRMITYNLHKKLFIKNLLQNLNDIKYAVGGDPHTPN